VVLTSVALGGTLFGIIGAFLAVPAIAVFQVIARYVREQLGTDPAAAQANAAEPHESSNVNVTQQILSEDKE
jgi:predicted PurR-regulated permease PerM